MIKSAAIKVLPGLFLSGIIMVISILLADYIGFLLPFDKNPIRPILVSMLLGLLISNSVTLPSIFTDGIKFGIKKVLRIGIVLMGIRISIISLMQIGIAAIGILIVTGLCRLFKINKRLGTLIAAGTSICGISAIVATAPTIGANDEETSYAIGTITIFGLIATAVYPFLVEVILKLDIFQAGFFLGTSIHDTSQVTAASLIYNQLWERITPNGLSGGDIAITTKLIRNTLMIAVIPILGIVYKKSSNDVKRSYKTVIPLFVLGYVGMGGIRFLGDLLFNDSSIWIEIHTGIKTAATYLITIAIGCVSLNTRFSKLRKLGFKPLLIGFLAALSLGLISYSLVSIFHKQILL